MSWLLFLDESGHDHKQTPYEIRGGVAIKVEKLRPLIASLQDLQIDRFGCHLPKFGSELKGRKASQEKAS